MNFVIILTAGNTNTCVYVFLFLERQLSLLSSKISCFTILVKPTVFISSLRFGSVFLVLDKFLDKLNKFKIKSKCFFFHSLRIRTVERLRWPCIEELPELLQEIDFISLVLLCHSLDSVLILSSDSILHTICSQGEKAIQETKCTGHHRQ